MAKLIPSAERIKKARALIQQARDLVKFIPKTPTATPEMKEDVRRIFEQTEQTDRDLLRMKPHE